MRRIGIFGGTFDPPHAGHLGVARAALRSGEVDEVWMMVSPQNPFKKDKVISPEEDRLEMTRLAVGSLPEDERSRIHVSDFETLLPKPTYTVTTLRALKEGYPDCHFRLLIGGDNLSAFSRWRAPDEILRDYGLIVYPRPGDSDWNPTDIPPGCVILDDVPLFPVSSTEIRAMAAEEPERLYEVLPEGVADYIIKNELYGKR